MNKRVIQKCIDELNKESPKLDYVRGILETLVDQDELAGIPIGIGGYGSLNTQTTVSAADHAAKMAESGFVKGIKPMEVTETNIILN